ncbi:SixA phosphatase family protein [Rhizobium tumorigenes]|uniref:Histidine phosphatase family protein n=1 Tax=Rhizobium tumorigenes TaxID=2041385 RepID=A0AAF1KBM9_9HYPH|nr:histidine phosphatase family protein [Rhizobium tumorigenes]WFR96976.1 histidine phosphatase family protein [Rhizobium tumorigenes]
MTRILPPPSRIYLLRHAEAAQAQPGERDFDRALNDNGFAQAEIVADKAADKGYRPDLVVASTALRCRQTTDAFKRAIGATTEVQYVDGLYDASQETYLDILSAQTGGDSIMLVGHNPIISQVLEALIGHDAMQKSLPGGFPTAGFAVLDSIQSPDGSTATWILSDFIRE